jgi:hypothetical protein
VGFSAQSWCSRNHACTKIPTAATFGLQCCTRWLHSYMARMLEEGLSPSQLTDNVVLAPLQHWDCMPFLASSWMDLQQPSRH